MRFSNVSKAGRGAGNQPKENQDYSFCGTFPLESEGEEGYFMVVSDGLGSKAQGKLGAESLCRAVAQLLHTEPSLLTQGNQADFLAQVHRRWLAFCGRYPIEDCGCTGLIGVVEGENVHLFRLGDGFLAGVWLGESHILLEDKVLEGKFLNETDCLGEDFILGLWEYGKYPRHGLRGLIACTDGIELGENTVYEYEDFARGFLREIFKEEDAKPYMAQVVRSQTNKDDKTMAILLEEIETWRGYLAESDLVYDLYGHGHQRGELISQGGQGAVYRTAEPNIALKIAINGEKQEEILDLGQNQVFGRIGTMSLPPHITLPQYVLEDYVGYTMELLEDMDSFEQCFHLAQEQYPGGDSFLEQHKDKADLVEMLHNYKKSGGLRRRLLAYYKLSTIFIQLHSRGLVFGDFSPKNVFFSRNHHYSHVWLIDVDNVEEEAVHRRKKGYYTPRFVSPEVAKKQGGCSAFSDDYSFALALFLQLTGTHPFAVEEEGDSFRSLEDFGEDLFLKQRDQGEIDWILEEGQGVTPIPIDYVLSEELLALFRRTFSKKGRENPLLRSSALEWQEALGQALDRVLRCPHCGMDFLWEKQPCPWCDGAVAVVEWRSFRIIQGKRYEIGSFVQERQGEIPLPLRLLEGNPGGEGTWLLAEEKGGELYLTQLHPRYTAEMEDSSGTWGQGRRNFALAEERFTIHCESKEGQYEVEVRLL